MKSNIIKFIFSKKCYILFSMFYLFTKLFFYYASNPVLTYIMFGYGIVVFLYNIIHNVNNNKFFGMVIIVLILLIQPISILFNSFEDKISIIRTAIIFFINFLVYVIPDFNNDDDAIYDDIKLFSVIMVYISCLLGIISIIQYVYLVSRNISSFTFIRLSGLFGNPNLAGWFFLTGFICALFYYNDKKEHNFISKYAFANVIFQIFLVVLSGCRSAILVMIFVFLLYKLMFNQKFLYFFKKYYLLIVVISVILLISACYLTIYLGRGLSGRYEIYLYSIDEFLKYNKLFGLGVGSLKPIWKRDFDIDFDGNSLKYGIGNEVNLYDGNTHNIFLKFLCTNGIVGLLLFIFFIIYVFLLLYRIIKQYKILSKNEILILFFCISFIFSGLIIGLFDEVVIFNIIRYINLFFMLSISYIIVFERNINKNEKV